MSEVLSQDEIDALLSAISTGEVDTDEIKNDADTKKVKMYDFRRPDKFSKEQIRTLNYMHEAFSRLTTTALSAQLRSMVSVHVASVDQLTYEEFIRSIPSPTTISVINMDPLKGNSILEIDPSITFTIIDRLFGGPGEANKNNRELTDIEMSVMEGIIVRLLGNLRESWAAVIDLRPRLGQIETNPQFAQIVPPNDMVVLITFETRVGEVEGMMNFCIPYITLEPVIAKLSAQYWYSSIKKGISEENMEIIQDRLNTIKMPLSVEICEKPITFNEVMNLGPGDVIKLDEVKINSDFVLKIGKRKKYYCRPGKMGTHLAVQIGKSIDIIPDDMYIARRDLAKEEASNAGLPFI